MGKLVQPRVYMIGEALIDRDGLQQYLEDTDNTDFAHAVFDADEEGLSDGEILTSFYSKLCYLSLTEGKNKNLSGIRGIKENLLGTLGQAHGSVFEHVMLNFVIHNASRVFECELIRARVGTAFSIESGRYARGDSFNLVYDSVLDPVKDEIETLHYLIEERYQLMVQKIGLDKLKDKDKKKQITSALRRIMPEGKAKEIGFSVNLRQLRHMVQLRTSRHSEWEIRLVFGQIYNLVKERYPLLFHGAKEEMVNGLLEVSGMKLQPYEKLLKDYSTDELIQELTDRNGIENG